MLCVASVLLCMESCRVLKGRLEEIVIGSFLNSLVRVWALVPYGS